MNSAGIITHDSRSTPARLPQHDVIDALAAPRARVPMILGTPNPSGKNRAPDGICIEAPEPGQSPPGLVLTEKSPVHDLNRGFWLR